MNVRWRMIVLFYWESRGCEEMSMKFDMIKSKAKKNELTSFKKSEREKESDQSDSNFVFLFFVLHLQMQDNC